MTAWPDISVVMGVYNNAARLPETIASVRAQTFGDWEFIVVNDGSTDQDVAEILADQARQDARLKTIHKRKEGLTRALLDGCRAARGRYIARVDAGDVMTPDRLETQKALLDAHPEAVLATCWTEYCGPAWEPLYTVRNTLPGQEDCGDWVASFPADEEARERRMGPTHHGSVLFRRSAYDEIGGYRPPFYYGQDWDLWYRLAERGTFAGVQRVLYRCRIFPDGISMRNVKRQRRVHACSRAAFLARSRGEDERPFLEQAARLRPANDAGRNDRPSAAGAYFIGAMLLNNRDARCRRYLLQAWRRRPFLGSKAAIRWVQSLWKVRARHE